VKLEQSGTAMRQLMRPRQIALSVLAAALQLPTVCSAAQPVETDLQVTFAHQVVSCWSPPAEGSQTENSVVEFDLFLAPNGAVARLPQLTGDSRKRAAGNPHLQAAAEAALRAILMCAPYKLPADRYEEWKEINPLRFDPRGMPGQ
jgi:hypothetical protein